MARKRRGRGEGGIRYREDKGLWCGELSFTDGTGKRRRESVYAKTKGELLTKLARRKREMEAGIDLEADRLSVGEWLNRWLEMVKPTVEPGTYRPYEQHCRLHIIPHLGEVKLTKLKRAHVQALYPALTGAGVSAALQRKIGTTLTIALNRAVDSELIPSNPAARVRKPKAEKPKNVVLGPEEVCRFLEAARSDRHYPLY
jgi:integrase